MGTADCRRFAYLRMCDQNRFHFGGTEPLAGYFNRVVAAAQNVPESIVIDRGPIAVDPDVGKSRPIGVDVTLSIFPEAARHSNPRLPDYEFPRFPPPPLSIFVY